MDKPANNNHPIHDLLRQRWSPRAFSQNAITPDVLRSLFEAARWTPSSRNQQPWRFIVATQDDPAAYEKLFSVLKSGNQRWAGNAPLLVLTVAEIGSGDSFNRNAVHDVGQAVGHLTVQATAMGLFIRQMGGIYHDRARELYNIPDGYEVLNAMAIGYPAPPEVLPDDLQDRENAPRQRYTLETFVFREWGETSPLIESETTTV